LIHRTRVALAYSGSTASSAAVARLREETGAEVVTVTVDVGQSDDLDEVRGRALACGAVRAHVIDARETFARDYVVPALEAASRQAELAIRIEHLALPLVARMLVDIAAIEGAGGVAHAASRAATGGDPGAAATELDAQLARTKAEALVVHPVWAAGIDHGALLEYARARNLPAGATRVEPHLLIRRPLEPARAARAAAHVDIAVEGGVPVSINGVQMTLPELIESLSLLGAQHGIGYGDPVPSPAALLLHAAYRAMPAAGGTVRLALHHGSFSLNPELVNHP
jgi:argininosuccinate synthase